VRRALLRIEGVVESDGVFGDGPAFWVNGTQIAYFDGDSVLDLRLTRPVIGAQRDRLLAAGIRRRSKSSDWVMLPIESKAQIAFALELAAMAAAAHRPAAGVSAKPPPQGADLERRRRFH
jgi:hypothetical protein